MSPSADSANPPAQVEALVAEELLDDGEAILLTVKPSGWFVLLASAPVLAIFFVAAAGAYLGAQTLPGTLPWQTIFFICVGCGVARLVFACMQWVGRLYLLTTRRVLTIRGVFSANIYQCPLRDICATDLSAASIEKVVGVSSLMMLDGSDQILETWPCLARGEEVRRYVDQAIRRNRSLGS